MSYPAQKRTAERAHRSSPIWGGRCLRCYSCQTRRRGRSQVSGASVLALQRGRDRRRSQEPRGSRSASFSRATRTTEAEHRGTRPEELSSWLSSLLSSLVGRWTSHSRACSAAVPLSRLASLRLKHPATNTRTHASNCAARMKHPVRIVVAVGPDNGIGYKGGLPWPQLPLDLHMFRQVTTSTQDPLCRVRSPSLLGSPEYRMRS